MSNPKNLTFYIVSLNKKKIALSGVYKTYLL